MDLNLHKSFQFKERYLLEFRAEAFNFTNTPHFGLPAAVINSPPVGQIRSAGSPRQIQGALKFAF